MPRSMVFFSVFGGGDFSVFGGGDAGTGAGEVGTATGVATTDFAMNGTLVGAGRGAVGGLVDGGGAFPWSGEKAGAGADDDSKGPGIAAGASIRPWRGAASGTAPALLAAKSWTGPTLRPLATKAAPATPAPRTTKTPTATTSGILRAAPAGAPVRVCAIGVPVGVPANGGESGPSTDAGAPPTAIEGDAAA